ncbi:MAG: transketolase [Clostridia bacterium]
MNRQLTINAARMLAIEQIAKANSGHPGLPLGAAPAMNAIFSAMENDPTNSSAINRDRFVLSAGHGSALLYATLHLFGYNVKIDDLKNFRQMGSVTPGHPEYKVTDGVDASTGPLGQGIANAVGMAMAETMLSARFNKTEYPVFDHYTYALCGEGCLMEGVGFEAMSLAGTLKLNKLILVYDKNNITIEGDKDDAFDECLSQRFEAQHWNVIEVLDGNDVASIDEAISRCKNQKDKPSVIIVNTTIGYGSPVAGTAGAHGSPLKDDKLAATKAFYNWENQPFELPNEVYDYTLKITEKGIAKTIAYNRMMDNYKAVYPELYLQLQSFLDGEKIDVLKIETGIEKPMATREVSSIILNKLSDKLLSLVGGSADLGPSNLTVMKQRSYYSSTDRGGSNIHFGIREQAMAAICNGIALHGGLKPYCSTFFVFSDYMKGMMRMSALMNLPVTYILTHDSIGVGEDGPTHEPIEQLAGLRAIPNLMVFRPADAKETLCGWDYAINGDKPIVLVLSRQALPQYNETSFEAKKGGYIVKTTENPEIIIIASGSELDIAMKAYDKLIAENVQARLVSMPSIELFYNQDISYIQSVLPDNIRKRLAVEAAASMSWYKVVGLDGAIVAIDAFGASAKPVDLFNFYKITTDNVYSQAKKLLQK